MSRNNTWWVYLMNQLLTSIFGIKRYNFIWVVKKLILHCRDSLKRKKNASRKIQHKECYGRIPLIIQKFVIFTPKKMFQNTQNITYNAQNFREWKIRESSYLRYCLTSSRRIASPLNCCRCTSMSLFNNYNVHLMIIIAAVRNYIFINYNK